MANFLKTSAAFRLFCRHYRVSHQLLNDTVVDILLEKPVGTTKNLKGWVTSVRKMKSFIFLDVNDGTSPNHLQVVLAKDKVPDTLQHGSSVDVIGQVKETEKGQLELFCKKIEVIGECNVKDNYPFVPKQKHSLEYCRQYLHLRPKLNFFTSMLRIRHEATFAVHKFFNERGFVNIHTPVLTSNDCEGAGEVFMVQPSNKEIIKALTKKDCPVEKAFFGHNTFLTVSGQLHLEAINRGLPKVYNFNPAFRAENSKSRLHLSEFYMIEGEEAFVTNLEDVMNTIEQLIKYVAKEVIEKSADDLSVVSKYDENNVNLDIFKTIEKLIDTPFTVMSFEDSLSIIKNNTVVNESEESKSEGFSKEEELFLVQHNDNVPVFIINWPKHGKPFYMKSCEHDPELVSGVDLLVPVVGELCGGSLREDNYNILKRKLSDNKLLESFDWYLELRKFGSVPTGGFGLGFERLLQLLMNVHNIKDVIPFPRWPHNLTS